jgi:hypothetical protein
VGDSECFRESRTFLESLFRRDAETNTRDARAPRKEFAAIRHEFPFNSSDRIGKRRIRFPLAAKTAFMIAGTMGGTGGSPIPNGDVASLGRSGPRSPRCRALDVHDAFRAVDGDGDFAHGDLAER